jgi:hypothetical protein
MARIDFGSWESLVVEGDNALEQGDLDRAGTLYRGLLGDLPEFGEAESPAESVATVAVVHRVAVVELVSGQEDTARTMFEEVDSELDRALRVATEPTQQRYIQLIQEQSQNQRGVLPGQLSMRAVCQHGCPWITAHCPFPQRHC